MSTRSAAILIVMALGLQACAGRSPLLSDQAPAKVPGLLQFTNPPARSMNLPLLRESPLPKGAKEVRIWIGFGIVHPDFMLRFQIGTDGTLTGTMLAYAEPYPTDETYYQWISAVLAAMCSSIQGDDTIKSCSADASRDIRWNVIYRQLVAESLWTLPDESELPEPKYTMSDGEAFVVELRDGKGYRAYQYANPGMREGLTAERATALMHRVDRVIEPVLTRALPKE